MNIILLGGPGSGKGTQAQILKSESGLLHISSGQLFRDNINQKTPLGELAEKYICQGKLVPNDITISMIKKRLQQEDAQQGVILDGFPRDIAQAKALSDIFDELHCTLDCVIYIEVSDEEIIHRLSGRLSCKNCGETFHKTYNPFESCPENKCQNGEYLYQREDDKPETIKARLDIFHERTQPVIEYYKEQNLLITVSGHGKIAKVSKAVLKAVPELEKA